MHANKRFNNYEVVADPMGAYVLVELTQGQWAKCDIDDWFSIGINHKWFAVYAKLIRSYYAATSMQCSGRIKMVQMHREILGVRDARAQVDHKNHDTLNNRRNNIRSATPTQNQQNKRKISSNTSGYIGVNWHKNYGKWEASIRVDRKLIRLGVFDNIEEAARMRDDGVRKYFGEFAGEINNA